MVTLEANAGSWGEDETGVISVMHDEKNTATDYTGDVVSGTATALSATDLRGEIRGRIANDSNTRTGLTGDESRAGVVVNLHAASAPIASGANRGRRTAGAVVATAETDDDGVYMFDGLVVGRRYFVMPQGTDLYTAVRTGDANMPGQLSTHIVTHALAQAATPPPAGSGPAIPSWNYHTSSASFAAASGSTVHDAAHSFVLLYKDGEVDGDVSDPSARAAHSRSTVELRQCRTTNFREESSTGAGDGTALSQCEEYTDVVVEADVDAAGNWNADGLREGIYEVVVDLPAGYINVATDGSDDATAAGFFSQQMATLTGGRSDATTQTFHIKDRNASPLAALTAVSIGTCAATSALGTAGTHADNRCTNSDDATIAGTFSASPGATIRLSSENDDASPTATGTYSQSVRNGRASSVALADAGSRRYFVHVRSADGYATSDATSAGFNLRRNTDTRMDMLTISWGGDRIDLNRRDLGLEPGNPDGETSPVTGTTDIHVLLDEGDNGAAVPTTALSITIAGKNTSFDQVQFSAALVDDPANSGQFGDCPATIDQATGSLTVEANAAASAGGKGEAAICFTITDNDEGTGDMGADSNANNMNRYRLILTRR